jgi:hypothetical protein
MISFLKFISESNFLYVPEPDDTLSIDRKHMPQIAVKDHKDFMGFLKKQNVGYKKEEINPQKLKATQRHFHKAKIKSLMDNINVVKHIPILVSKDNYVIDGHHRWLAHYNLNKPINVLHINLPVADLIVVMNEYPRKFTETLY